MSSIVASFAGGTGQFQAARCRGWKLAGVPLWSLGLLLGVMVAARGAAPVARLSEDQQKQLTRSNQLIARVAGHYVKQEYAAALPLAREAVELRRGVLGDDSRFVMIARNSMALVLQDLGRYDEALPEARESLRVSRLLGRHNDEVEPAIIGNLSLLYQRMGQYRLSLPLAEESLERAERKPELARSMTRVLALNNLAVLHRMRGEVRRALPYMRQAIELVRELKGEKDPNYGTLLSNLASLYHETGDARSALLSYEAALDYYRKLGSTQSPGYALALTNRANMLRELGDTRRGVEDTVEALAIFRKTLGEKHPFTAVTINNLGSMRESLDDNEEARRLYEEALALCLKYRPTNDSEQAIYQQNLGFVAQKQRRFAAAKQYFETALALRKKAVGERHPEYAKNVNNLAIVHQARGEYAEAARLYERAVQVYREATGPRTYECAVALCNLAMGLQAKGSRAEALRAAEEGLTIAQSYLEASASVLSDRQRQQAVQELALNLEVYLGLGSDQLSAEQLYNWVVVSKTAGDANPLEERLLRSRADLRGLVEELRDVRAQLAKQATQIPATAGLESWRQRFDALERRKEEIQAKLSQASSEYARRRRGASAAEIAKGLKPGSALIEFITYGHRVRPKVGSNGWEVEPRILAFVLQPGQRCRLVVLGAAEPIETAIRRWRQSVTERGSPESRSAELLRRRVWEPLEKHLAGCKLVLLAPEGELARLPFAALPGRASGRYLLEEYTFGYLTNGRQVLEGETESIARPASGLLAVGGVSFGRPAGKATGGWLWNELVGTELELQEIVTLFARRFQKARLRTLKEEAADRAGLLRELQGEHCWRYLHVGTHGAFEEVSAWRNPQMVQLLAVGQGAMGNLAGPVGTLGTLRLAATPALLDAEGFDPRGRGARVYQRNPMLSCSLVLAGANRGRGEGHLSAEEIAGLDLRGCELAVLSACETGLGRLAGWQGVQGFQRGFHEAGVRNVLASLWGVSDAAACVLMEEFYRQLWEKGETPLEALRQAQLMVLKEPERVARRKQELENLLARRRQGGALVERRGPGMAAQTGPPLVVTEKRSRVSLWGAWILSGPAR